MGEGGGGRALPSRGLAGCNLCSAMAPEAGHTSSVQMALSVPYGAGFI